MPRLGLLYFSLISTGLLVGYRWVLRLVHRIYHQHPDDVARVLIIGAGKVGHDLVQALSQNRLPGVLLVGYLDDDPSTNNSTSVGLPVLGGLENLSTIVAEHRIDEVLIALPVHAHSRVANLVAELHEHPVRIRVVPDFMDLALSGATVESLCGIPLIGLRDPAIDDFQRLFKRLMDIVLSGIGLLVLAPVFLVTALAIKLEDGGSIFYRAERVGENGKLFRMWKFRSMVVNADKLQHTVNRSSADGTVVHKQRHDPRITRVGRLIRRTSIDELPQLFNVLVGEMSLVGPRPELPWLVAQYEPWQRKRLAVPQGITGWWQVNGRSDNLMHVHTALDLHYINKYSLWLDVQILWKTLSVVLRGKGAY